MSNTAVDNYTDNYLNEYTKPFVDKWDELVDWNKRWENENLFFQNLLKGHNCRTVLDIATGTGFHSVMLSRDGFSVTSADGSDNMLRKAKENGRKYGVDLSVVRADWRHLSSYIFDKFDAVVCLGNSFTHIFDSNERRLAMKEIYKVLKNGGLAIIDQRNYDAIIKYGYTSKHTYHYCGKNVEIDPDHVSRDAVRLRYTFSDKSNYLLTMYPILQDKLTEILKESGFKNVERYGDFSKDYEFYEPDFITQVGYK
ncbi:MAG: class I SAM-dependent methyltransferase [Clostridiales bacterium]|nr:class I SAM-dependent methyltransferase [Clostridiales bacterium]MCF8021850.1 class I SAM-dependent methyltransferase [Clostridiales bacterium]